MIFFVMALYIRVQSWLFFAQSAERRHLRALIKGNSANLVDMELRGVLQKVDIAVHVPKHGLESA